MISGRKFQGKYELLDDQSLNWLNELVSRQFPLIHVILMLPYGRVLYTTPLPTTQNIQHNNVSHNKNK